MTIRPANADDAPAVAAIWNAVIRDTLTTFNPIEKTFAEIATAIEAARADGRGFYVVADPAVVGFAVYDQFRAGVGYRHSMEHTIHLAERARGAGLGRRLMASLEDHARRGGVHVMVAGVSSANSAGRAFHAAIGYCEVAVLPEVGRKSNRWLDLHLMLKHLDRFPP